MAPKAWGRPNPNSRLERQFINANEELGEGSEESKKLSRILPSISYISVEDREHIWEVDPTTNNLIINPNSLIIPNNKQ